MEVKFSLRPHTILCWILQLGKLEWESLLMILVGLLMTRLFWPHFGSLLTLIWHLLWLGVEAGVILFLVGMMYFGFLKMWGKVWFKKGGSCVLADVLLSLFFQCGLRFPGPVWDWLVNHLGKGAVENDKKLPEELEEDHAGFWYDDDENTVSTSSAAQLVSVSQSGPAPSSNSLPPDGNDSDSDASLIHKIIFEQMMTGSKFPFRNN
ncbi:hypothetical protein Ocin01_15099 [Orchesella cincta]|uniref:Uncharacterized protein n=1 Tax=Orchesella cincta TaxID=48709 RepID=A0A1D2MF09_ORCCI|nr:hypothetical protein Ocin01_15099 [Orchesella cincta]